MLLTIRKKSQGWVAWLIVLIIAIPFALFGINSYFEGVGQVTVAKVEGEKINAQTFANAMEQRRRFFRSQLGANFDPAMVDNPEFRLQVVEGLVSNRLIQNYAQENGLRLSDEALLASIVENETFQVDGKFDQDTYRRAISARGYSTEGFERQARVTGGIEQVQTALQGSALVNPQEVDQLLALMLQQREADYTVLSAADVLDTVTVSEEEKRKEYDANEADYQQAERVKLEYLTLSLDDMMKDIELDDEEIQQAYEANKGKYLSPETRMASHILFAVKSSATQTEQEDALTRANKVLERIRAGEDFATLASEFSEDPGSKLKGGELGIIAEGQMVPNFEKVVYSMNEGEVSDPVRTEFGYHIIKLDKLDGAVARPLAEVRDQVIKEEKRRLATTQFNDSAETFRTMVFEEPDNLDAAAEALGLELKISDWVTRDNGKDAFANPRVRSAAFDSVVLDEVLNSDVIELEDGSLLSMHKNEYQPQITRPFEEVAEQIEARLKQQKAEQKVKAEGEALIAELKAGEPETAPEFIELPKLRTDAKTPVEQQLSAEVFSASLAGGEALVSGFTMNNGDYAVYRLKSIVQGDPASATEEQRSQLVRQLESRDANSAYSLFRQTLRKDADVEIFSSSIEDDSDILAGG